ncbi:transcriptional regulator, MarR family [Burkholderia sp. WP9]|uniref:MarR family winged helix-turn-helix transcriptional regulator n=1 Tax=Burkholderia sp. WP9 TaxID=1500263 RepID=UPI0008980FB9|nr:MarR family transcriptional regulator [Burkholderia sp. WP9]SEE93989.1 transcriptional regulator, MarR family [Burkholderia sp. WP9]
MSNLDTLRRTVSSTLVVAARKWRRTSHGVLAAFNVSEACATPLLTASRLGSAVRQVTLADHIGIEGPSLVRLLDQLCAAGLMRRDEDPEDRRAKTVVLTEEGRAVTAKMEEELVTLRAQALKDVSRSDLEATLRVLAAFTGEVSEPADESSNPGNEPAVQAREEPDERASRARAPAGGRVRHAAKANKSNKGEADTAAPQEAGDPA